MLLQVRCDDPFISKTSPFFDAPPDANIVRVEHNKAGKMIAARAIPHGLTEEVHTTAEDHRIRDPI